MDPRSILFIADFNIDTLARQIAHTALPGVETRTAPYGAVVPALLNGSPGPEWTAVVWTLVESISPSFRTAAEFGEPEADRVLDEVRAFAASIARFARGTRATFVPSWVMPPWYRGYGPIDHRPGLGIAHLLARMNVTLADTLSSESNVFVLDTARWLSAAGARGWSDKLWYATKSPFALTVVEHAAADIAAAIAGLDGRARRIVILDLDDVLWGGVVGEVGWQGLTLGGHDHVGEAHADFQRALKALTRRGIQLAIVSKNDEAVALEAIDRHPEMLLRQTDFAAWRINWQDKAENVVALLSDLGLGAESAVFIDDSAIERARVSSAVLGMLVPDWPSDPARFREALASLRCFDAPTVTADDRARGQRYSVERTRRERLTAVGDLQSWLDSLGVVVESDLLTDANLERAAQLYNKTNQMNLASHRRSSAELMEWASAPGHAVLTFRVSDQFGDSGLTGLIGLECDGPDARLSDFLISCRVMGRGVEETILHVAVAEARRSGARTLVADFHPTSRNAPCRAFFSRSGFRTVAAQERANAGDAPEARFAWDVTQAYAPPAWVTLRARVSAPA